MLRRLAVGLSAAVLAMLVAAVPAPAAARDAAVCTGWDSEYQPPASILVLRTAGPRAGRVVSVPFRAYVETVLAAEFGRTTPREALRAGAVAVKQYAWYYAIHWRGGHSTGGSCYDVVDSSVDQIYQPETYRAADALKDAVAFTWPLSLRKFGRFFMTGYRDGASVSCASNADGWRLYQLSAYRCASDGRRLKQILHAFFDPGLEIVVPGERDSTGDSVGDAVAVADAAGASADPAADTGASAGVQARLYDGRSRWAASGGHVVTAAVTAEGGAGAATWARGDVTGDRVDDLVGLARTNGSIRLTVLPAGSGTFQAARLWWSGALPGAAASDAIVRLLVGDLDGDGRADAALLVGAAAPAPDPGAAAPAQPPAATLWMLPSTGSGFSKPVSWWRGRVDLGTARAVLGDVTGDGEDDLVLATDIPVPSADGGAGTTGAGTSDGGRSGRPSDSPGVRYEVAASRTAAGLADLAPWMDAPGGDVDRTLVTVGDVNRDGRDDLIVDAATGSGGSQVTGLLSTGGSFWAADLWSSSSFRWAASKVTAADVDADGRADLVVFYDVGSRGTRISQLVWNGSGLRSAGGDIDPKLDWATATVV